MLPVFFQGSPKIVRVIDLGVSISDLYTAPFGVPEDLTWFQTQPLRHIERILKSHVLDQKIKIKKVLPQEFAVFF